MVRESATRRLGLRNPAPPAPDVSIAVPEPVPYPGPLTYPDPVWPKPGRPADPPVLAAGAAAGVVAAVMLPGLAPGIGWLITAVASAAGVWQVARWRPAVSIRAGWAGLAVALAAVPVFRDSPWLDTLCLLAAGWAGGLAVLDRRGLRALLFAAIAVPIAALRGLPWVARGLRTPRWDAGRVAGAVLAGVVLLVVFGALFAGADPTFARLVGGLLPTVDNGAVFWSGLMFGVFGFGVVGACYLLVSAPALADPAARVRLRRVEWVIPVGALVGLFALFVGLQLVDLFGGSGYVLRTAGLTYARYARTGFWQLAVVTGLTVLVIATVVRLAAREADRAWLRSLLGALALLTLVIVASALSRMWSYQQAYGFTVLRLLVETMELWLGLVYLLILAAGVRMRAGWVPRAAVAAGMAALLVLAVLNPDGFIAQRDVDRWQATGRVDAAYLGELSADAVPAVIRLPAGLADCALAGIERRLAGEPDDWRSWNAGRSAARSLLGDRPYPALCRN